MDGSQRLRTIEEFVLGDLALGDLGELSLLSGFKFSDLLESRQRKIKNKSIRGVVLNEHTDEQSRFDLFERINTGSKIANKAEVRRGALGGDFLDLVIALSEDPLFVKLAPVTAKKEKEREKEELITRFFAYGDGLDDYRDNVSAFLYNYTKKMNNHFSANPEDVEKYRQRFASTMEFVSRTFPWGFRKSANGRTSPRSRFESIAIGSYLAMETDPSIVKKKVVVDSWLTSKEFRSVTGSDGANAIKRLRTRIHFVRDHLLRG